MARWRARGLKELEQQQAPKPQEQKAPEQKNQKQQDKVALVPQAQPGGAASKNL
jgi:hypothetical protein